MRTLAGNISATNVVVNPKACYEVVSDECIQDLDIEDSSLGRPGEMPLFSADWLERCVAM